MPRESKAQGGTVNMSPEAKELTPWLARRFADRARPLAPRPMIGITALRLTHLGRQADLSDSNDRLAGPAINRTGPVFAVRPVARSPLASRASDFVLRKLTLVRAGWQQALSLPFVQRLRRSRSGARQDMPAGQWAGPDQYARQAQSPTFSEQDHRAGKTVRGDRPVTEKPLSWTATDGITTPWVMAREQADTPHKLPPGEDSTPESSQYEHIQSLPLTGGHMAMQQTIQDSDTSGSARGTPRPTATGGIYQSDQTQSVVTEQIDMTHERPRQVGQQPQHPDLAHRVMRAVTHITRQIGLQRSLLQARPRIISQRITGQQVPSMPHAYRQDETRPEPRSETVTPEEDTVPFSARLPAIQPAKELDIDSAHTLPEIEVPKRPTRLLSNAFGDLQRSLIKPARQDRASGKPEPSMSPVTPAEQDATTSRLSSVVEVSRSRDFEAVSYTHPPLLAAEESQASMGQAVTTPQPVMKSTSRVMTVPSQQLLKATADVPILAKSEDHGFPQSGDYVPSPPIYRHARQPAPALPVVSRMLPRAESSAARSTEIFRYTSDAVPQINHSGNHNGLELALAPASRAPETRTEPQTVAAEHRAEKSEEKQAAPDIRALAREVYPLIKRMIMIERDRHPTWY